MYDFKVGDLAIIVADWDATPTGNLYVDTFQKGTIVQIMDLTALNAATKKVRNNPHNYVTINIPNYGYKVWWHKNGLKPLTSELAKELYK